MREFHAKALGGYRALDTYNEDRFVVSDKNRQAFECAKAFDITRDNLYLFGPTGSGKSHLAAIAARRYINRATTTTQIAISREVRMTCDARGEAAVVDGYSLKPVLVIDDIGVGKDTEFSLSLLYEIISSRYMNMRGGLIVTSNLSLDEIAFKIGDERISSRLAQMCRVLSLVGERDRRVA